MAEGGTYTLTEAAELVGKLGVYEVRRPQDAPGPQEEENDPADEHSCSKTAANLLTVLTESPWYRQLNLPIQGLLKAAIKLLKLQNVSEENINAIIECLAIVGYVFQPSSVPKHREIGPFVPFKRVPGGFDSICQWLTRLEELEKKIKNRFDEIDKHLEAAAAKPGNNFEGEDWNSYVVKLKLVKDDLALFIKIIDRERPELDQLKSYFNRRTSEYTDQCMFARSQWLRFARRSSYKWWGVLGLGTIMAWQSHLFPKISTRAAVAAVGSLAVGGPLVFSIWALEGYSDDTEIGPLLDELDAEISNYEAKKEDFKTNLLNKNVEEMKKYLERFIRQVTGCNPRSETRVTVEAVSPDSG